MFFENYYMKITKPTQNKNHDNNVMDIHFVYVIHTPTDVCVCIYIWVCVCTQIFIYRYVYICVYTYMCVDLYRYVYVLTYTYICIEFCVWPIYLERLRLDQLGRILTLQCTLTITPLAHIEMCFFVYSMIRTKSLSHDTHILKFLPLIL